MASLLLGREPPFARTPDLIAWCGLFGIPAGTARVALHRMVAKGEAEARDGGYALAGRLERRRAEQTTSLEPLVRRWNGEWLVGVLGPSGRTARARAAFRDEMRRAHLAELREGVWTRPANLEVARADGVTWWGARPEADPVELASRLFHLDRWQARAARRLRALESATASLGAGEDGLVAAAFLTGADALRHVRSDPVLPARLLPADWLGADLRAAYRRFQVQFTRAAGAWFRDRAAGPGGR
jgi:phenylacetic acid degradation operon negative regulatory protein